MKTKWLKCDKTKNLILFFTGWGMDEKSIEFLESKDDILIVYDYANLDFHVDLNSYESITLIAWSFGVFAASHIAPSISNIQKSIAINGTLIPRDEKFGISPKVFDLTLKTLSPESLEIFGKKMFIDPVDVFKINKTYRTLKSQKLELEKIKDYQEQLGESLFEFDYALVSMKDKIIPAKNQLVFWGKKSLEVVKLNSGHFPFFEYSSWDELINETL